MEGNCTNMCNIKHMYLLYYIYVLGAALLSLLQGRVSEDSSFECRQVEEIHNLYVRIPTVLATRPHVQWMLGSSLGVKQVVHEANHSPYTVQRFSLQRLYWTCR